MGGVVSAYTALNGMDMGMFPAIDDQVDSELAGAQTGHIGPRRLAAHFEKLADETEKALALAARAMDEPPSKEYRATAKDFQILAHLARYHAHRQREGYHMARFYRSGDASLLDEALEESESAVAQWRLLVNIAEPHYYPHLQTGMIENGHWKDKTFLVETNPRIIRQAKQLLHTHGLFDWGFDLLSHRFNVAAADQPRERLIEHVVTGGVHGLFLLGITGEAAALSARVRRDLITNAVCLTADGKVDAADYVLWRSALRFDRSNRGVSFWAMVFSSLRK
jgi:hypothetical protein